MTRAVISMLAVAFCARAQEALQVHEIPKEQIRMALPQRWVQAPDAFADAVRSHIKKRFAKGPFAKFTFENIYLRNGLDGGFNLFGGEYLIVSWSYENITPESMASLAPRARKVAGNEMNVAWREIVTDVAWEQLAYDANRGVIVVPARARGFDGKDLRMKMYIIPTKTNWLLFFGAAGSAEPATVLAELDSMLSGQVVPKERLIGPEWWTAFENALATQGDSGGPPAAVPPRASPAATPSAAPVLKR